MYAQRILDFKRKMHSVCWSVLSHGKYVKKIIDLFNQVSDLHLQWQLNQSINQCEVGLKQREYKTPET